MTGVYQQGDWERRMAPAPPFGEQRGCLERTHGDDVDLSAFTIGPREKLCEECWTVHRPEVEC